MTAAERTAADLTTDSTVDFRIEVCASVKLSDLLDALDVPMDAFLSLPEAVRYEFLHLPEVQKAACAIGFPSRYHGFFGEELWAKNDNAGLYEIAEPGEYARDVMRGWALGGPRIHNQHRAERALAGTSAVVRP